MTTNKPKMIVPTVLAVRKTCDLGPWLLWFFAAVKTHYKESSAFRHFYKNMHQNLHCACKPLNSQPRIKKRLLISTAANG